MIKARAAILLACLAMLGGCSRNAPPAAQTPSGSGSADSALGRAFAKVGAKVQAKLEHQNITLSSGEDGARAEITPRGELFVAGKKVVTNDAQRALLLKYRSEVIAVATTGTDIGMKGADFGMQAAGKALRGVLSGNGDQIDAQIEADARAFEAQARKICEHLPPMLEAQQQLAAQLTEFKPYATMDQSDIQDCLSDTDAEVSPPSQ